MTNVVTTRIVKIGNCQGVRIPKPLLEQAGLSGPVCLEVEADRLILRPARLPRQDWDAQFQQMADSSDDALLDDAPLILTEWEAQEWEW